MRTMSDRTPHPGQAELSVLHEKIVREHSDNPHPEVGKGALKAHLLVHGMVEKQLLNDDPPETKMTLERLMQGGLDRHQAVHAIGEVVTREAIGMMHDGRELDHEAYMEALDKLTAESVGKKK